MLLVLRRNCAPMPSSFTATTNLDWNLVGKLDGSLEPRAVRIHTVPFQIGRKEGLALTLSSRGVSKLHAELFEQDNHLWLRDLGSTNGTFVNGRRVSEPVCLFAQDMIQIADVVFRLQPAEGDTCSRTVGQENTETALLLMQLDRLMSDHAVVPFFQPIVRLCNMVPAGFEILGRSRLFGLNTPAAMFKAAAQLDLECQLSRVLRDVAAAKAATLPGRPLLFLNTHPKEVGSPELVTSITELRQKFPSQRFVLEIHEAVVTEPSTVKELVAALRDLEIGLAYDDFGAGQARLLELSEFPPDYLKFDIKLIHDIHQATASRQHLLKSLIDMVRSMQIVPLAEGVEKEGEHLCCRQLGFEMGQGFFYGRPKPAGAKE